MESYLFNSDCFVIMKYLIQKNVKVDAIIADPPYNISYTDWDKNFNIEQAIILCKQLLKPDGNIILFQGWSNVCQTKSIMDNYFNIQNWVVYDRIKGRGSKNNLVSTREDILWYSNGKKPKTYNKIYSNIPKKTKGMGEKNGQQNRALTNVWYDISPIVPWSPERNGHPTQKPLELMKRIVTIFTDEGDFILDFTMGTGTTGEAAISLERNFIGIEKEKEWFDIAYQRINKEEK